MLTVVQPYPVSPFFNTCRGSYNKNANQTGLTETLSSVVASIFHYIHLPNRNM